MSSIIQDSGIHFEKSENDNTFVMDGTISAKFGVAMCLNPPDQLSK